ncbi:MAG: hypothetical protein J5950_02800 [Clostridia bacterium]|nr:hypothetical protein [Clostridia bacterium]
MIRTDVVKLTVIPAWAYRQKLTAGGSGIIILRTENTQPGIASVSKTSGEPIVSENTNKKLFPEEAFKEALALTAGMPYKKQSGVRLKDIKAPKETKEEAEALKKEADVAGSEEYKCILSAYTDKSGKFSYDLLNKDLIKLAHSSSIARKMAADGESVASIRNYVVRTKFRNITGNEELSDASIKKITALLDEVNPKGLFKELNSELRKKLKDVR